jgi:hypothetical protein
MSVGASGRLVIEVDPQFKKELYSVLTRRGMTLKEWFLAQAGSCIASEREVRKPVRATPKRAQVQGGA